MTRNWDNGKIGKWEKVSMKEQHFAGCDVSNCDMSEHKGLRYKNDERLITLCERHFSLLFEDDWLASAEVDE